MSNSSNAEVALAQTVTVRMADKRGAGINGIQPVITLVDGGGVQGTEITVGTCSVSDYSGLSTCKASSNLPGTYYAKVTAPKVFQSATPVTFVQKLYALEFSQQPTCATCAVGTAFTTSVRVIDRAGKPITTGAAAGSPITIALTSPGAATLAGTLSGSASAGIASFSGLSMNKIGTYTITASSGGSCGTSGAACGTSAAFTVKSGIAAKIKFITQPGSGMSSGQNFAPAPAVGLFDAADNPVTSSNCTINLTREASSPAGTLLGTTSKVSVNGVSDFSLNNIRISTTVGGSTYKLHASASGATGCVALAQADSEVFAVTLTGVPYQLSIAIPPSVGALSQVFPAQPQIHVLDVDGNLCAEDQSSVITIAKDASSPGGTTNALLVGPSSIKVTNGVANFSGLFIDSTNPAYEGTYVYNFGGTGPGISLQGTSASHYVSADGNRPPFRFEFIEQPQSVARKQILPPVKVRKIDVNGYLNFTDSSTQVALSLVGGGTPSGLAAVTMSAGVATFDSIKIDDPSATGVKKLTATETPAGSIPSVDSSSFAISSYGAAAQVRFIGSVNSSNSTDNNPWVAAPYVVVQDSANNRVMNDSTTQVTISIFQHTKPAGSTAEPVLMGATTRTVSNGEVTFSDMRTDQLGITNMVLQASLAGQSNTFNGNVALTAPASPATGILFGDQPVFGIKSGTVDRCFISKSSSAFQPISVKVVDSTGSTVTTDNTTVITLSCVGCTLFAGNVVTVSSGVATFNSLVTATDNASVSLSASAAPGGFTRTSNSFALPECTSP
ncbi:MAG: hypothetical protein EOP11_17295 [Proteobacteria bacterium]|nr:MAG: hypothetical protein EOP11_17295 [Pseudomonadota bacterium]